MNVVHATPVWLPRTQTWMYNQVRFLPDEIVPHVVCERVENYEQFPVAHLHALANRRRLVQWSQRGLRRLHLARTVPHLHQMTRRLGAPIIHSHFGYGGWANLGAAKRARAKHIVTFYGVDVNATPKADPIWYTRYRSMFARVDRVLCEGPHMAQCIRDLGCPAGKVFVQHLGVDVDGIGFAPRSHPGSNPLMILIVGTFREKKGIPDALAAVGKLVASGVDARVTIVGDVARPEDEPERQRIVDQIAAAGLQGRCRLAGFLPHEQLFRVAQNHHVLLSPSVTARNGDTEGGAPVTLIELAATGMPIVSTNHADIPNVMPAGLKVLLSEEHDVDGLVASLRWLLDHKDWDPICHQFRQRVEQAFSAPEQGRRLADHYRAVAG